MTTTEKDVKEIKIKKNGWQISIPVGLTLALIGLFIGNKVVPCVDSTPQSNVVIQELQEKTARHGERIDALEKLGFQNRTLIESLIHNFDGMDKRNEQSHDRIEVKLDKIMTSIGRRPD